MKVVCQFFLSIGARSEFIFSTNRLPTIELNEDILYMCGTTLLFEFELEIELFFFQLISL